MYLAQKCTSGVETRHEGETRVSPRVGIASLYTASKRWSPKDCSQAFYSQLNHKNLSADAEFCILWRLYYVISCCSMLCYVALFYGTGYVHAKHNGGLIGVVVCGRVLV